jgi:hypothetical protein
MIAGNERDPAEPYALTPTIVQILRVLAVLRLLPRAVVGTASFAGLREGELRGLEGRDCTGVRGVGVPLGGGSSRSPVALLPVLQLWIQHFAEYGGQADRPSTH